MHELSDLILKSIPDAKFGSIVDVYPMKAVQTVIELDPKYISERLGVQVPLEESRKILEGMVFGLKVQRAVPQIGACETIDW